MEDVLITVPMIPWDAPVPGAGTSRPATAKVSPHCSAVARRSRAAWRNRRNMWLFYGDTLWQMGNLWENHHFIVDFPIKMVIFHGYAKLP